MAAFLTAQHCVTKSTPIYFVPQIILYHGNLNQTRAPGSHLEEGDRVGVLGVGGNPCGCAGQEKAKQPTCRLHKAELRGKTTDSKCTTRLEGQGYTKPQKKTCESSSLLSEYNSVCIDTKAYKNCDVVMYTWIKWRFVKGLPKPMDD